MKEVKIPVNIALRYYHAATPVNEEKCVRYSLCINRCSRVVTDGQLRSGVKWMLFDLFWWRHEKTSLWHMRSAKALTCLRICSVSLCKGQGPVDVSEQEKTRIRLSWCTKRRTC